LSHDTLRCAPRTRRGGLDSGLARADSNGGYKESDIGRDFSLEGMLESYTQRKNVTVSLKY
jgi:hypothetical protein